MAQHLIHIGYPKTGSTFLQAWFERQPELHYAPGGLGGFRNVYELCRHLDADYKCHVTSCESLSMPQGSTGDINLAYIGAKPEQEAPIKESQASICAVLKSLYPNSRVLIVTRGFKGIILSTHSQFLRMGGRLHLNEMSQGLGEILQRDGSNYYDYDYLIQLYSEAFGEDNLIILPYELLRDDQDQFLAVLETKLDLKHIDIALPRLNASLSPAELYWYPVISRRVSTVTARLGTRGQQRLCRWYVGKTLNNKLRPLIKILQRWKPDKKITEADFPIEVLKLYAGKATRLKEYPLYAPYAAEYLWDG